MFLSRKRCTPRISAPEEPPSNSLPINATLPRRIATLSAVFLLGSLKRRLGSVLFLTDSICVKYGEWVDLSEAASMVFIQENTSVPVPKVHCAFTHKNKTYIVMERIRGQMLGVGWLTRSEGSKALLLAQLKLMVDEIRGIDSPYASAVASVDGGSLFDMRLPGLGVTFPVPTARRFGPFQDIPAFHRWLRRPAEKAHDQYPPQLNKLIEMHENNQWGPPVFTHADLSTFNIMVDGDEISGIIDWERSGWYPSYWEYTRVLCVSPRNAWWVDYVDKFLEPTPKEWEMECIRREYFNEF